MKNYLFVLFATVAIMSCEKEAGNNSTGGTSTPSDPTDTVEVGVGKMNYISLNDEVITSGNEFSLDIDSDRSPDFTLKASFAPGTSAGPDKLCFMATSSSTGMLLLNTIDSTLMLKMGEPIMSSYATHNWKSQATLILAQQVYPLTDLPYWEGAWQNEFHRYLPVQVRKNGLPYNGWIEISMDSDHSQMVLHKAAICKEAGTDVKAGL